MEPPASNPPLDLLEFYKSPEVAQMSSFGDVAGQLDAGILAAAYGKARNTAPRRHDRQKSYFVDHAGLTNRSDNSNRREWSTRSLVNGGLFSETSRRKSTICYALKRIS